MKFFNKQTGMFGEKFAAEFLIKKGYQIQECNFANKYGEIDIIAKDKDILVFVEVKAKKGVEFGIPEEMISIRKLKQIQHMATVYMNGKILPCRIDIVAIIFSSNNTVESLKHYENVYI